MKQDDRLRRVLWASVVFNLLAAYVFAFPASALGQFVDMPAAVPVVYRALLGFFILLFGGAYAWVASQSRIDRTIVALAAIGKAGAFAIVLILWLAGESTLRGVLAATGDLAFALVFAHWVVFTSANEAD